MGIGEAARRGRTDLSSYLVHLTRDSSTATARSNLLSIVAGWEIEARSVHGAARKLEAAGVDLRRLRSVCMSETPLEELPRLAADLPGRQVKLAPYGVIMHKDALVARGANPVWYTHMGWGVGGGTWPIKHVEVLIAVALNGYALAPDGDGGVASVEIENSPIAGLAPFIETVSPSRKDFSWERESRVLGNLDLGLSELAAIVVPDDDVEAFRKDLRDAHRSFPDAGAHHGRPVVGVGWGATRIEAQIEKARRRSPA